MSETRSFKRAPTPVVPVCLTIGICLGFIVNQDIKLTVSLICGVWITYITMALVQQGD